MQVEQKHIEQERVERESWRLPLGPMPRLAESAIQRLAGMEAFPQPPLIPLRYPVVLMHGFGMMASLRRGGHLHDEALSLRLHGVRAYAPNVAPYSTVAIRAPMWKERIERVLEETGAAKVSLVAHSMGGLDARHLIANEGMHEVVACLTTISTPHHGSSVADVILCQPERLRAWAAELVNWVATSAMTGSTSDVLQALSELTPAFLRETFNPAVPDHPSVTYWSYAGAAGKGTNIPINPFLRLLDHLLYAREGVNDGFVSVDSARWGDFLGIIDADHAQQVGLQFPGAGFDSNAFYRALALRLAEAGF